MAFSYKDTSTGKSIFDIAEANISVRSPDGELVPIVTDGKLVIDPGSIPQANWATLAGKPAVIASGADVTAARNSIGAAAATPTETVRGGILQQAAITDPDPGGADAVGKLGIIIQALRAAGVIKT